MAKFKLEIVDLDYYRKQILCQEACPVHTDALGFINATVRGDYEAGYIRARQPNPFVSTCGRVCNAPCEKSCRRGNIDAPISIRALKRFVCERHGVEAMSHLSIASPAGGKADKPIPSDSIPFNSRTKESLGALVQASTGSERKSGKVAVIGAGPAGLAAAHDLAVLGHRVTIFETASVPGGMLRLGVPEFRLPRNLIGLEIAEILERGVELKLNTRVGEDLTLKKLREDGFESIFIAVGLHRSRELNVEGAKLNGVLRAVEFLLNINMGYKVELGQKVLVIGGGAVALDVARIVNRIKEPERLLRDGELATAPGIARETRRSGVPEVHVVCLERREEMPALPDEVEDALAEGIILHTSRGPSRILGDGQKVKALETVAVASVFDSQRRFNPTFVPGTETVMEGDTVILAIGQGSDLSFIKKDDGLEVTARGTIAVDPNTLATSAPGIFAGGDVVFGPRIIIEAVRDGHTAARAIDEYLQGRKLRIFTRGWMEKVSTEELPHPERLEIPRQRPPMLTLDKRVGISEVESGYSEDTAIEQASRCLKCNIQTVFNSELCLLCGGCVDVCPMHCLKLVPVAKIEGTNELADLIKARYGENAFTVPELDAEKARSLGTAIIKDETRCIRCGLCSRRCPVGAITMEAFWFEEELISSGERA